MYRTCTCNSLSHVHVYVSGATGVGGADVFNSMQMIPDVTHSNLPVAYQLPHAWLVTCVRLLSPLIVSALRTKRHHHGCSLAMGDETALLWHRRKSLWSMVFFLFYERVPQGLRILYPRVILDNTKSILLLRSTRLLY